MVITQEDWNYVKDKLVSDYKFTKAHAHDAAKRLYRDHQVFKDFVEFKKTNKLPIRSVMIGDSMHEYSVNGHSVSELIYNYDLSPVGAFLMLSEISSDPEKGESYLERILEHGHETPVYDEEGTLVEIEMTMVIPKKAPLDAATPLCAICGKPGTWIDEYKRWYCHDCGEYLAE